MERRPRPVSLRILGSWALRHMVPERDATRVSSPPAPGASQWKEGFGQKEQVESRCRRRRLCSQRQWRLGLARTHHPVRPAPFATAGAEEKQRSREGEPPLSRKYPSGEPLQTTTLGPCGLGRWGTNRTRPRLGGGARPIPSARLCVRAVCTHCPFLLKFSFHSTLELKTFLCLQQGSCCP